jgi:hypothetical protein
MSKLSHHRRKFLQCTTEFECTATADWLVQKTRSQFRSGKCGSLFLERYKDTMERTRFEDGLNAFTERIWAFVAVQL